MRCAFGCIIFLALSAFSSRAELPPGPPPLTPLPDSVPKSTDSAEIPEAEEIPDAEEIPNPEPVKPQAVDSVHAVPENGITETFSSQLVPQEETRVAVLGYHDFSRIAPVTEMRINTDKFREQMLTLKQLGIPIITLSDFLEWKLGDKLLPAKCILITIDDGWKSVYTDAFPILKELNIPFTIFPYTKFITGLGASMSEAQIKEMLAQGAELGSHSVSHLYPKSWRAAQRQGQEAVRELAEKEIAASRVKLQERFPGSPVLAYCYPGGHVLPEMIEKAEEGGFKVAFTVIPGKVDKNTPNWHINRYMVFGKDPKTFTRSLNFSDASRSSTRVDVSAMNASKTHSVPRQPVMPTASLKINGTPELISISLAQEQNLDPAKMEMSVSGFGMVRAKWDPQTKTLNWSPSRHIYSGPVLVRVRWYDMAARIWHEASWQFDVDNDAQQIYRPANLISES